MKWHRNAQVRHPLQSLTNQQRCDMLKVRKANVQMTVECPFDEEPRAKITFIGAMDVDKRGEIFDLTKDTSEENLTSLQSKLWYRELLKRALISVENVIGIDGTPLFVNGSGITDELLDQMQEVLLPPKAGYDNLLAWAGSIVWQSTILSEDAKKNLEQLSSQSAKDFTLKKLTPSSTGSSGHAANSAD